MPSDEFQRCRLHQQRARAGGGQQICQPGSRITDMGIVGIEEQAAGVAGVQTL